MPYVIASLLGYLLGCSNMALYISRAKGIDLQSVGTGNLGTSNAIVVLGLKNGIIVFLHDLGKAVLAVLIAKWIFPALPLIGYVAGIACVFGHMFPFYLKFHGGKGFASYLGVILGMNPLMFVAMGILIIFVVLATDYIVVGTVVTVVGYPLMLWLKHGMWAAALIMLAATVTILIKHIENFVHMADGTETGVLGALKKSK